MDFKKLGIPLAVVLVVFLLFLTRTPDTSDKKSVVNELGGAYPIFSSRPLLPPNAVIADPKNPSAIDLKKDFEKRLTLARAYLDENDVVEMTNSEQKVPELPDYGYLEKSYDERLETHYESGSLKEEAFISRDGKKVLYKFYYENGQLAFAQSLVEGYRIGKSHFYNQEGIPTVTFSYLYHFPHGAWTYYKKDGSYKYALEFFLNAKYDQYKFSETGKRSESKRAGQSTEVVLKEDRVLVRTVLDGRPWFDQEQDIRTSFTVRFAPSGGIPSNESIRERITQMETFLKEKGDFPEELNSPENTKHVYDGGVLRFKYSTLYGFRHGWSEQYLPNGKVRKTKYYWNIPLEQNVYDANGKLEHTSLDRIKIKNIEIKEDHLLVKQKSSSLVMEVKHSKVDPTYILDAKIYH